MTARRHTLVTLVLVVSIVAGTSGVATAQATRAGGTVTVEAGETVGDLRTAGGTVVVRGTVDGNLRGYAGTVVVAESGVVTGDLQASAGSVNVLGTVRGDVEAAAGSVSIGPGATVGGDVSVAAGSLVLAGTVDGSVEAAVQRLQLVRTASVAGNVQYSSDAELVREDGATVAGGVTGVDDLSVDAGFGEFLEEAGPVGLVVGVYGVAVTLLIGAVLLIAFPEFSGSVAGEVADSPVRNGGIGLGTVIGVPILLVVVALTVVGIPLALLGLMALGLAIVTSAALGEYAVGSWVLSKANVETRWGALVLGVVGVAVLARIPIVGRLIDVAVFLVGFGAVVSLLVRGYRRRRREGSGGETSAGRRP